MKHLSHLPHKMRRTSPTAVNGSTPIPESEPAFIHFDGACNPNPGPMGIGYTIGTRAGVLVRVGAQLHVGTNNEAEYLALIAAMRHALRLGLWTVTILSDSLLVVMQVTGRWQVKSPRLRRLALEASMLFEMFASAKLEHVPRVENREADKLSHESVFEEPTHPSLCQPEEPRPGQRALLDWQAAAARVWYLSGTAGVGVISRIFGVAEGTTEQIAYGKTYKDADFTGVPQWHALDPLAASHPADRTPPSPTLPLPNAMPTEPIESPATDPGPSRPDSTAQGAASSTPPPSLAA